MKAFLLASGVALSISAFANESLPAPTCGGTRVLMITDSHGVFGQFGPTLQGWLQQQPRVEVDTYAFGALAPVSFLTGATSKCAYVDHACSNVAPKPRSCATLQAPLLSTLLPLPPGAFDRKLAIVVLGTNQILDKPEDVVSSTAKMASMILASGTECAWVGPPRMRRFPEDGVDRTYALLTQALDAAAAANPRATPCRFIDSRRLSDYPAGMGDGVHYDFPNASPEDRARGDAIARGWATGVIERIRDLL
jgi:hypothetical protein